MARINLSGRIRIGREPEPGTLWVVPGLAECPHLGAEDDPETRLHEPDARHRCYLAGLKDQIDLAHQENFCLTPGYCDCPWIGVIAPARLARPGARPGAGRKDAAAARLGRRMVGSTRASWHLMWAVLRWLAVLPIRLCRGVWRLLRMALQGMLAEVRRPASHDPAVGAGPSYADAPTNGRAPAGPAAHRPAASTDIGRFGSPEVNGATPVAEPYWYRPSPRPAEPEPLTGPGASEDVSSAPIRDHAETEPARFPAAEPRPVDGDARPGTEVESGVSATPSRRFAVPPLNVGLAVGSAFQHVWGRFSAARAEAAPDVARRKPSPQRADRVAAPAPAAEAPRPTTSRGRIADGPDHTIWLALSTGATGDLAQVSTLFRQGTERFPEAAKLWLGRSSIAQDVPERMVCLAQALALQGATVPESTLVQLATSVRPVVSGRESAREGDEGSPPASCWERALIEQGLALLEAGFEPLANLTFTLATELNARSELAWFWKARTADTLDELVVCLERALAINPTNEKLQASLALAVARRDQQRRKAPDPAPASAPAKAVPPAAPAAKPSRVAPLVGSLVGILLGGYWTLAGLPAAVIDRLGLPHGDMVPKLTLPTLPPGNVLEVAPGVNLLALVPLEMGSLYLLLALGLARRQPWCPSWGLNLSLFGLAVLLYTLRTVPALLAAAVLSATFGLALLRIRRELDGQRSASSPQPSADSHQLAPGSAELWRSNVSSR